MYTVQAKFDLENAPTYTIDSLLTFLRDTHPSPAQFLVNLLPWSSGTIVLTLDTPGTSAPLNVVSLGSEHVCVRARNLDTCASIIFQSLRPAQLGCQIAYVWNSPSGYLSEKQVKDSLAAIGAGNPPDNVVVAIAHMGASDPGCTAFLKGAGIPDDSIVEITDLSFNSFGINSDRIIGF